MPAEIFLSLSSPLVTFLPEGVVLNEILHVMTDAMGKQPDKVTMTEEDKLRQIRSSEQRG